MGTPDPDLNWPQIKDLDPDPNSKNLDNHSDLSFENIIIQ